MLKDHINIQVFGTVSAGKSTFINTLFANYITPTSLKKCTMNPQTYQEQDKITDETTDEISEEKKQEQINIDNIYNINKDTNKNLYGMA